MVSPLATFPVAPRGRRTRIIAGHGLIAVDRKHVLDEVDYQRYKLHRELMLSKGTRGYMVMKTGALLSNITMAMAMWNNTITVVTSATRPMIICAGSLPTILLASRPARNKKERL